VAGFSHVPLWSANGRNGVPGDAQSGHGTSASPWYGQKLIRAHISRLRPTWMKPEKEFDAKGSGLINSSELGSAPLFSTPSFTMGSATGRRNYGNLDPNETSSERLRRKPILGNCASSFTTLQGPTNMWRTDIRSGAVHAAMECVGGKYVPPGLPLGRSAALSLHSAVPTHPIVSTH